MTAKKSASRGPSPKVPVRQLRRMALDSGALKAKVVSPSDVETGHWVRWKCRFGCGSYESSLMCPPHTPMPAETRLMLDEYKQAILFESPPGQAKRIAAELERKLFLAQCVNDALVILNQQLNREARTQGTHSKVHWILTLGARK